MKLRIFNESAEHIQKLEEQVNDFIKDKKVIDIKFSTEYFKDVIEEETSNIELCVLVMYEEKSEQ